MMAKGLMIALGLGKPSMHKGKPEDDVGPEVDLEMGDEGATPDQLEAAKGLIDAVRSKDAEAVVMAYKALKYCCEDEEDMGEEEAPSSSRGSNPPGKMGKY